MSASPSLGRSVIVQPAVPSASRSASVEAGVSRPTALPSRLRLVGNALSTTATRRSAAGVLRSLAYPRRDSGDSAGAIGNGAVGANGEAELVAVVDDLVEREAVAITRPSNSGMATPAVASVGTQALRGRLQVAREVPADGAWMIGRSSAARVPTSQVSPSRPPARPVVPAPAVMAAGGEDPW